MESNCDPTPRRRSSRSCWVMLLTGWFGPIPASLSRAVPIVSLPIVALMLDLAEPVSLSTGLAPESGAWFAPESSRHFSPDSTLGSQWVRTRMSARA